MLFTVFALLLSAIVIYYGCELFVNAIEWVGRRFNISDNAVGTVLAAFGTALPESIVTLIAVVFGASQSEKDIGIGAALGGPLILSTIGYAIVGFGIIACRVNSTQSVISINHTKLGRDQLWFLSIFMFNAVLGVISLPGKAIAGVLLLVAYGLYCYKEMSADSNVEQVEIETLKFRSQTTEPETAWILFQTIFSLSLIFIASQVFVNRLEYMSRSFAVPSHVVSLFLSPIATELPETLNAIIWIRQGKVALALGNISGSMMIQATIPSALGLLFTPWLFDRSLALAVIATMASILYLYSSLRRENFSASRLSLAALFYVAFVLGVFWLNFSL